MWSDRAEFIRDNLGLARSCVSRYVGRGIEYDDLYQTACVGLIKAADSYDKSRGTRFSTYAVPVILGEIRQLFRSEGSIKVSRGLRELNLRAMAESERFANINGRYPRIDELASILSVDAEELTLAICASQRPVSLTCDDDEGDGETKQTDVATESFDEYLTEIIAMREALKSLSESDRRIIRERYAKRNTQTVTAKNLGMTQVQVSRRETKIIAELRRLLEI